MMLSTTRGRLKDTVQLLLPMRFESQPGGHSTGSVPLVCGQQCLKGQRMHLDVPPASCLKLPGAQASHASPFSSKPALQEQSARELLQAGDFELAAHLRWRHGVGQKLPAGQSSPCRRVLQRSRSRQTTNNTPSCDVHIEDVWEQATRWVP